MFLLLRRADIPSGFLQIDDIRSPSEHSNQGPRIHGPLYLRQPDIEQPFVAVGDGGANERVYRTAYTGLAAWMHDNIADTDGSALSDADAMALAQGFITRLRAGQTLDAAAFSAVAGAVLGGAPGATTPEATYPSQIVPEVLRILAGEIYEVPAGSLIQNQFGNFIPVRRGSFLRQTGLGSSTPVDYYDAYYASGPFVYNESSYRASKAGGKIAGFTSSSFTYLGVAGAAVTVYNPNGTLA